MDARLRVATPLRGILNKVFPDHWSFLLGKIALYSFIVLLVTGTFLTFFFEPSMEDVVYDGVVHDAAGNSYVGGLRLHFGHLDRNATAEAAQLGVTAGSPRDSPPRRPAPFRS